MACAIDEDGKPYVLNNLVQTKMKKRNLLEIELENKVHNYPKFTVLGSPCDPVDNLEQLCREDNLNNSNIHNSSLQLAEPEFIQPALLASNHLSVIQQDKADQIEYIAPYGAGFVERQVERLTKEITEEDFDFM